MQANSIESRESGQTMSEYVVVLAVITPFLVAAFALLSDAFIARLGTVVGYLS